MHMTLYFMVFNNRQLDDKLLAFLGIETFFISKFFFLGFDYCRFRVVIRFFIPATTANDLQLRRISIPDFIHYILILS